MNRSAVIRRSMHNLASKFTGAGGVHVVDPNVDFRYLFKKEDELKRSVEERRLKIDVSALKQQYDEWWNRYSHFKQAGKEELTTAKRELREAKEGLLAVLALPNVVSAVGQKEKAMLKPTKHAEYLCPRGLMRIDRENELVHLVGYPVLLQQQIKNHLMQLFADAQLVSTSAFARPAVLEAVNLNLKEFSSFSVDPTANPEMYLVGNSLPSMISPFIRAQFSEKNDWPLIVQSAGMAYHVKRNTPNLAYSRQRLKHCVLTLSITAEDSEGFATTSVANIAGFLQEELELEVKARQVLGKELRNYESQAIVFEDRGLELARISRADDYLSRRLNIRSPDGGFMHAVYVETDIDRVLARLFDGLIDGRDIPAMLRRAMA